jgi:hypothetical protein
MNNITDPDIKIQKKFASQYKEKIDKNRKLNLVYPPDEIRVMLELFHNHGEPTGKDSIVSMDCYEQIKLLNIDDEMKILSDSCTDEHKQILCSGLIDNNYYDGTYTKLNKVFRDNHTIKEFDGITDLVIKTYNKKLDKIYLGDSSGFCISEGKLISEHRGMFTYSFNHYCKYPKFLISPNQGNFLNIYVEPKGQYVDMEYNCAFISNYNIRRQIISSIWHIYKILLDNDNAEIYAVLGSLWFSSIFFDLKNDIYKSIGGGDNLFGYSIKEYIKARNLHMS